jgi:uncharacterized protein YggE
MRRTLLTGFAVIVAVVAAYFLGTVHRPPPVVAADGTGTAQSGVIVAGTGATSGTPDVLRVSLGVEVRRADVSSALRDANSLQSRIAAAFRRDGVADKDLQTSDVSLTSSADDQGRPNGYTVNEQLTAKLRDLSRAGRTISDAVAAGGNAARLQGVSFDLEDNAALLQKARDAAFADAERKAQRYADLAGRKLGPVETVSEGEPQGDPAPISVPAVRSAPAVPISPGQARISVSVTVRWSLAG